MTTRLYSYNGEEGDGAHIEEDFDQLIALVDEVPGANLKDGEVECEKMTARANPMTRAGYWMSGWTVSGGQMSAGAGLTREMNALVCFVNGDLISKAATNVECTATKDNYIDFERTGAGAGSYHVTAVANGASPPAIYSANSIRLQKAVTDGSDVTSVTDLRTTQPLSFANSFRYLREGLVMTYKDADEITVSEGEAAVPKDDGTDWAFRRLAAATDYVWSDHLDSGSSATVKTWYYVYLVADNPGEVPDICVSEVDPDTGPTDYDYWLYLGAIRTQTASTDLLGFERYEQVPGRSDMHEYIEVLAEANPADTDWHDVDCVTSSAALPATARAAILTVRGGSEDTNDVTLSLRKNGSALNGRRYFLDSGTHQTNVFECVVPVDSAGVFEYMGSSAKLERLQIDVVGWLE